MVYENGAHERGLQTVQYILSKIFINVLSVWGRKKDQKESVKRHFQLLFSRLKTRWVIRDFGIGGQKRATRKSLLRVLPSFLSFFLSFFRVSVGLTWGYAFLLTEKAASLIRFFYVNRQKSSRWKGNFLSVCRTFCFSFIAFFLLSFILSFSASEHQFTVRVSDLDGLRLVFVVIIRLLSYSSSSASVWISNCDSRTNIWRNTTKEKRGWSWCILAQKLTKPLSLEEMEGGLIACHCLSTLAAADNSQSKIEKNPTLTKKTEGKDFFQSSKFSWLLDINVQCPLEPPPPHLNGLRCCSSSRTENPYRVLDSFSRLLRSSLFQLGTNESNERTVKTFSPVDFFCPGSKIGEANRRSLTWATTRTRKCAAPNRRKLMSLSLSLSFGWKEDWGDVRRGTLFFSFEHLFLHWSKQAMHLTTHKRASERNEPNTRGRTSASTALNCFLLPKFVPSFRTEIKPPTKTGRNINYCFSSTKLRYT